MEADCIHFKDTGYFSKIIIDYLERDEKLKPFYQYAPNLDAFNEAIANNTHVPRAVSSPITST